MSTRRGRKPMAKDGRAKRGQHPARNWAIREGSLRSPTTRPMPRSPFFASPFDEAAVMVVDGLGSTPWKLKRRNSFPSCCRAPVQGMSRTTRRSSPSKGPGKRNNWQSGRTYRSRVHERQRVVYMAIGVPQLRRLRLRQVMASPLMGDNPGKTIDEPFVGDRRRWWPWQARKEHRPSQRPVPQTLLSNIPPEGAGRTPHNVYTEIAYAVQTATEDTLIEMARHLYRISRRRTCAMPAVWASTAVANKKYSTNTL
jgi:hypothetical protein